MRLSAIYHYRDPPLVTVGLGGFKGLPLLSLDNFLLIISSYGSAAESEFLFPPSPATVLFEITGVENFYGISPLVTFALFYLFPSHLHQKTKFDLPLPSSEAPLIDVAELELELEIERMVSLS